MEMWTFQKKNVDFLAKKSRIFRKEKDFLRALAIRSAWLVHRRPRGS